MEKPIVSVIGSCRVHSPMKKAEKNGLISLYNENIASYCHSSREALQKLRFVNGRIGYPDYLRLLINGTQKDGDKTMTMRGDLRKADIYVIEVSSKKRLFLGDFSLQMNFFQDYFVKPNNLQDWWKSLVDSANKSNKPVSLKPSIPLSKEAFFIASKVELGIETDASIDNDIKLITDYLKKPIILVGHFDILKPDGKPIKERQALNNALRTSAEKYNAKYFEPATLINEFGNEKSLRPESTNHWAVDFEETVGKHIFEKYIIE